MADSASTAGWIAPDLAEELPGLAVYSTTVDGVSARAPKDVARRLRALADRINGGWALHMRQDPVPWSYRVFWRRIGLDPDRDRTPVEQLVLERLRHGGLPSQGIPRDAAVIATLETGVPVLAFDDERLRGRVGMRGARAAERVGEVELATGEIAYCDEKQPIATLAGELDPAVAPGKATKAVRLVALEVEGVPRLSVEDALWTAAEILREPGADAGSVRSVD